MILSPAMITKPVHRIKGFTLVELITVILIVSILSVVGASKFLGNSTFKDSQVHQELLSAFRFAQKIAIASQCPITISLTSNSYQLSYSSPCSGNVKHPADQNAFSKTGLPVVITSSSNTFSYDAAGNMTPATGGVINIGRFSITLEAVTGFAHE